MILQGFNNINMDIPERHFDSFSPAVLQVHLTNRDPGEAYLPFSPSTTSEDSQIIALDIAEQALGFPATYIVKNSYVTDHNNIHV
jgi:hypothetical protein